MPLNNRLPYYSKGPYYFQGICIIYVIQHMELVPTGHLLFPPNPGSVPVGEESGPSTPGSWPYYL